jgi:hypothetical protein
VKVLTGLYSIGIDDCIVDVLHHAVVLIVKRRKKTFINSIHLFWYKFLLNNRNAVTLHRPTLSYCELYFLNYLTNSNCFIKIKETDFFSGSERQHIKSPHLLLRPDNLSQNNSDLIFRLLFLYFSISLFYDEMKY